eukprot:3467790-Rhodomonas_salina.1
MERVDLRVAESRVVVEEFVFRAERAPFFGAWLAEGDHAVAALELCLCVALDAAGVFADCGDELL